MAERIEQEDVIAGQQVYNPFTLFIYDMLVVRFSNSYIWRCPARAQLQLFKENMTKNHLDVGVGSGYYVAKAAASSPIRRVGLLDLNPNSLDKAAARLQRENRITAECYQENVLASQPLNVSSFDSVSFNYLFHCLPGGISEKVEKVVSHVSPSLSDGAKVFGSTIIGKGISLSGPAKKLMSVYNKKKIFSNLEDDVDSLKQGLESVCGNVSIKMTGCVAVFSGDLK